MQGFTAIGDNEYYSCQFYSDASPQGQLTGSVLVQANVPALYAYISDPVSGAYPAGGNISLTVTAPDGTVYNQDINTSSVFAKTVGGQLYVLYIVQPAQGAWTVSCRSTTAVSFRASVQTVPTTDPLTATLRALQPRVPVDPQSLGATIAYDQFRWGYWSAAVLLLVASATSGLALNLTNAVEQLFAVSQAQAQQILTLISGQSADGVITTLAQQTGYVSPEVNKQVLLNGAADNGLTSWTLIANGGDGWAVQSGYADEINYTHNFAASYAWCTESQLVDLLQGGGLTAAYLDQAPMIDVTDWVTALYPSNATAQSQYYLLARLLDANQQTLKEFQTGTIALPLPSPGDASRWHRIQCTFTGYGPNVRYVYLEHGGLDPQQWNRQFGVKITGASVQVQLAIPQNVPAQLVQNGNGQNGLTGWTDISPASNAWTTEAGPGVACPVTAGNSDFAVASGQGKKYQVIDLVNAGYTTTFLDTAPLVLVGQWIASSPDCTCSYSLKIELRDQNQQVIQTLDFGTVQTGRSAGPFVGFQAMQQTLSGYGSGLRFIYFEHGASPDAPVPNQAPAKITGASVQIPTPPAPALGALAAPVPIGNTLVEPYKWICWLIGSTPTGQYVGSGWLIPKSGQRFVVVTAGHVVYDLRNGWPTDIRINPAAGGNVRNPYIPQTVRLGRMQLPINYLLKVQAQVGQTETYDYGALIVDAANWDNGGFNLTVEQDNQLQGQAGSITGFPAEQPYTTGKMYQENITFQPANPMYVYVPTNFTGGASGSPIYVQAATYNGLGVFSYTIGLGIGYPIRIFFSIFPYATRVTNAMIEDIQRWSNPLSPDDRVCQFQLVIRTGTSLWLKLFTSAGTDDPITFKLDNHDYPLNPLWMPDSGSRRKENEDGHFDGYDLTSALQQHYPGGPFLRDLLTKPYQIVKAAGGAFSLGGWLVESAAIFVNGQLLCYDMFNRWVFGATPPDNTLNGTVRIS